MKILIVEARFYEHIADHLIAGAVPVLDAAGVAYERLSVPGALEIPGAMAMAKDHYAGFIALGCVIRGETTHYETVCNESARGLMDLSLQGVALANGILTCENEQQALERADPARKNKGADFARALLQMLEIRHRFTA